MARYRQRHEQRSEDERMKADLFISWLKYVRGSRFRENMPNADPKK
jgi:hypothetical protein